MGSSVNSDPEIVQDQTWLELKRRRSRDYPGYDALGYYVYGMILQRYEHKINRLY